MYNYSKIKMKIEDLRRYYDSLCEKLKNGTPDIVLNDDRAHNSVIERFMLDSSKTVCMYCGEMSVFRKRFYAHIDSSIAENETEENGKTLGTILKDDVVTSLRLFMDKPDARLHIFFEKYDAAYLEDLIDRSLFLEGISIGKINLYKLDDNLFLKDGVVHTSFTDTHIIRIERNPLTHEAICAINASGDIVQNVEKTFKSMFEVGEKIKLIN